MNNKKISQLINISLTHACGFAAQQFHSSWICFPNHKSCWVNNDIAFRMSWFFFHFSPIFFPIRNGSRTQSAIMIIVLKTTRRTNDNTIKKEREMCCYTVHCPMWPWGNFYHTNKMRVFTFNLSQYYKFLIIHRFLTCPDRAYEHMLPYCGDRRCDWLEFHACNAGVCVSSVWVFVLWSRVSP